jgi:hypothetical protein
MKSTAQYEQGFLKLHCKLLMREKFTLRKKHTGVLTEL